MTRYIDISVPLHAGMVCWPGDPPVRIEQAQDMGRGDECNLTILAMSGHAGTHIDAPLHYLPAGSSIDQMPIDAMVGPARVLEIRDPQVIHPDELRPFQIRSGERVLFKTRNSQRCWNADEFVEDYVYLAPEAAEHLVTCGVQTVGIDYLSVGRMTADGVQTHSILMRAGIWIIEGLDLSGVQTGAYELICLPLRLAGAEGAPARAVLRALPEDNRATAPR